jgi:hypothetical protein
MHVFRNTCFVGVLIIFLLQCKPRETEKVPVDIHQFNWGTATHTVLENGFFHSKKTLDTVLNQLVGDTLIPISTIGPELIIEKLEPLKMEMKTIDGLDEFYITKAGFKMDTFTYEIKNYFNKTFLILISENSSSYAYELKNNNVTIPETNNLYFPDFRIEGYAVGDIIDRDDIEVMSKDQFGTSLTEMAIFRNNNNVILKIINEHYIEEMQWKNISDSETQNIIKQLNNVFSKAPDIEYASEDTQTGSDEILNYYWSENEINVLLTRINEFGELDDFWSLNYSNLIVSDILNNFLGEFTDEL